MCELRDLLLSLPIPHNGKTGWPWIEASEPLPDRTPDGSQWPKISIVTPSYNQGQYLEETIRSVLLQNYPNLEYIIIDGGSTDGSVEIIKKYEPWLTYWESMKDRGQPHAINKGFARSTGEIMAWINSDDYYAPNAFFTIAKEFNKYTDIFWVVGNCDFIDKNGKKRRGWGRSFTEFEKWFVGTPFMQPGVFWKRKLWEKTNYIDEGFNFSFDYELWFQFAIIQSFPHWIDNQVAFFRKHDESKSVKNRTDFYPENRIIQKRYSYLSPGVQKRLRIIQLKQERKSVKILNKYIHKIDLRSILGIISALFIAPWMIFKIGFYYQIKKNLLDRNS